MPHGWLGALEDLRKAAIPVEQSASQTGLQISVPCLAEQQLHALPAGIGSGGGAAVIDDLNKL